MKSSEQTDQLFSALSAAQGEMPAVKKTRNNKHLGSKYADLADCIDTGKGILSKHGLCIVQGGQYISDVGWVLVTRLGHSSGQWVETYMPMESMTNKAVNIMQGWGIGSSYSRRYGYTGISGMASEEDMDGGDPKSRRPTKPKYITSDNVNKMIQFANKNGWNDEMIQEKLDDMGLSANAIPIERRAELAEIFGHKITVGTSNESE